MNKTFIMIISVLFLTISSKVFPKDPLQEYNKEEIKRYIHSPWFSKYYFKTIPLTSDPQENHKRLLELQKRKIQTISNFSKLTKYEKTLLLGLKVQHLIDTGRYKDALPEMLELVSTAETSDFARAKYFNMLFHLAYGLQQHQLAGKALQESIRLKRNIAPWDIVALGEVAIRINQPELGKKLILKGITKMQELNCQIEPHWMAAKEWLSNKGTDKFKEHFLTKSDPWFFDPAPKFSGYIFSFYEKPSAKKWKNVKSEVQLLLVSDDKGKVVCQSPTANYGKDNDLEEAKKIASGLQYIPSRDEKNNSLWTYSIYQEIVLMKKPDK